MKPENRRSFLKKVSGTVLGLGLMKSNAGAANAKGELFSISLAQWSLNPLLFSGKMDNLDFARDAKKHGIYAIEYVNQFFKDEAGC